jgi:hypothetical protein
MPRSKTQISKLPRDLKEPIEFGRPALDWSDAQVNEWSNERRLFVVTERLRKLEVLMQEMKAPRSDLSAAAVLWLCIELAKKLYPGFRTDLDGTKRKGRPKRGKGDDDHLIDNPATSLMFVDAMRAHGVAETDLDACKKLVKIKHPEAKAAGLEKKAKSLASIVATMRTSGRRKAAGKLN